MGYPFTGKCYVKLANALENESTDGLEEARCIRYWIIQT